MMEDTKIRCMAAPWHCGVQFQIIQGNSIATNMTFEPNDTAIYREPFLHIQHNEAQVLIDDLWSAGYRPTEGKGSAGALNATERHLADMQKIAFKKLGIDK